MPNGPGRHDWLHQYGGLNIPIPAGDYFLTVYGTGFGEGNTSDPKNPLSHISWLIGADLQAEDLEQDFLWRSDSFPSPGFGMYAPAIVMPEPGQDPQDRWNTSFAIRGMSAPPCPPDINGDGAVNSNDFFAFLEDYFAGDADFNNDGATDSDDFFAFLAAYFEGC